MRRNLGVHTGSKAMLKKSLYYMLWDANYLHTLDYWIEGPLRLLIISKKSLRYGLITAGRLLKNSEKNLRVV